MRGLGSGSGVRSGSGACGLGALHASVDDGLLVDGLLDDGLLDDHPPLLLEGEVVVALVVVYVWAQRLGHLGVERRRRAEGCVAGGAEA